MPCNKVLVSIGYYILLVYLIQLQVVFVQMDHDCFKFDMIYFIFYFNLKITTASNFEIIICTWSSSIKTVAD